MSSAFGISDLSENVKFSFYAGGPVGGPTQPSEAIIGSADEYRRWLGDIDPGFNPAHNHLAGVDFRREMLVAVALGEVQLGTTVSIASIILVTGGITGGMAFVKYNVHHPSGIHIDPVGAPYTVVKCKKFSGFQVRFLRTDDEMPAAAETPAAAAAAFNPAAMTTLMLGEENQPTTEAIGEESPRLPTTQMLGEEGPPVTTMAIGEEMQATTQALGEESPHWTTLRFGEEGLTTLMLGEEEGGRGNPSGGNPFGGF